jgi:hypothetical protein
MNQRATDQLDKVLALADSSHEAEAVVAVRKARQMLSRDGLSFSDLARAAQHRPRTNRAFSIFSGAQMHLETQVVQLRQKLDDLQTDMQTQNFQIDFWRRRATELEQGFYAARADAERWRRLARETVEKLWELGQDIRAEEFAQNAPAPEASAEPETA